MTRIPSATPVRWTSQAGGYTREKSGKVIAFVPAGKNVWQFMPYDHLELPKSRIHFDVAASCEDRYLVGVVLGDGAVHYYAPRAHVLERQNPVGRTGAAAG